MKHNAYHRGHHRLAAVTAAVTFVLLIAGALVTSNEAGLAVPDWPTSFGSLYKIPPMVGGVKYEHGHRMVAQLVGLLTILLAVWTQRVEQRGWMRGLGWAALALVIVQGVLGGVTVLMMLPPWVSTAHATLAQTFFCTVVLMSLFSSRGWVEEESRMALDVRRPKLATLATWSAGAILLQLILGAAFRHSGMKLLPHLILAVVVSVLVLWTAVRVLMDYSHAPEIFRPAIVLLVLLITQLGLGFGAYLTRVEWSQDTPQPLASMVATTVAHVAVGALLLAASVVLVAQTRRHLADPDILHAGHRHNSQTPKAVHA